MSELTHYFPFLIFQVFNFLLFYVYFSDGFNPKVCFAINIIIIIKCSKYIPASILPRTINRLLQALQIFLCFSSKIQNVPLFSCKSSYQLAHCSQFVLKLADKQFLQINSVSFRFPWVISLSKAQYKECFQLLRCTPAFCRFHLPSAISASRSHPRKQIYQAWKC